MDDNERDAIIKQLFDSLDRDKSNTISLLEIDSILQHSSEIIDTKLLAERIKVQFDLSQKEMTWEEFLVWMRNEFNVASARGFSDQLMNCTKIPAFEVVLALADIKTRVSDADKELLEWCISHIIPSNPGNFQPQLSHLKKSYLQVDIVNQVEEYSDLPLMRLAISDEEMSRKSINRRLSLNSSSAELLDLNIYLPVSDFNIHDFDINIFDLASEFGEVTLLNMMGYKIFAYWDVFTSMGIDVQTFLRYCTSIGEGYKPNAYHNVLHAVDVLQACHVFLYTTNIHDSAELTKIHIASLLLAAIVHDYKHPGFNNAFLLLTSHKLAIRYNDTSILENYHVAKAFQLAQNESLNIFESLCKEELRTVRKLMISAVLATDMSKHSRHITEIQVKLFKTSRFVDEKEFILGTLLHLGDLSNPCRVESLSEQWALRISEEFFVQGDREREYGLEVNPIFDRYSVNIAKSQVGFISGVILPYITPVCKQIAGLDYVKLNSISNRDKWANKIQAFQSRIPKH